MRMVLLSPAVALVCLSMAILLSGRLRARMRTVARRPYGDRTRGANPDWYVKSAPYIGIAMFLILAALDAWVAIGGIPRLQ